MKIGENGYTIKKNTISKDGLRANQRLDSDLCFAIGMLIGDGTLNSRKIAFTNSEACVVNKYLQSINKLQIGANL